MRRMQQEIITKLQVRPVIDPHDEIKRRVRFLTDYLQSTGHKRLVLGISGGQDSTLAGKLAQLAADELRKETADEAYRFIAVRLPYGTQRDEDDAQLALAFIQPDQVYTLNIRPMTDAFVPEFEQATAVPISDYDKGNVKARMRMAAQYLLGAFEQALVVGTDHAAEAVTGFFTKFGDGASDVTPLTGLTKRQGALLLQTLHAPARLYTKTPTADLLDQRPGQADETELGIAYDVLDDYLEGKPVSDETAESIEKRYRQTRHKRELPVTPFDNWWRSTAVPVAGE